LGNRIRKERALTSKAVKDELISLLPNLRAFALYLCGNAERADDLVQDTVVKAWQHLSSFTEGTNLRAWLFRILRNTFLTDIRKQRMQVSIVNTETHDAEQVGIAPPQQQTLDHKDMLKALAKLSPSQRTAIILVGAEGFTYQEAAEICGCPVGTIKSRVNRARVELLELLKIDSAADYMGEFQAPGAILFGRVHAQL
jgi:RNA polymerase sigma-70 factor, ECF subfamily